MSFLNSILPSRVWVLLFGIALLAFVGCATGAIDCSIGKPVGLVAALGAAFVSLFDSPRKPVEARIDS